MQRIVIDTNVLVSSLISKSYPAFILDELVLTRNVTLILTEEIWQEYVNVLNRPKFARFTSFKLNADIVLLSLNEIAQKVVPTQQINLLKDLPDNRFLEAAAVSAANYLITGNTNDFTMTSFEGTKIVSPKEYWETCRLNE